MIPDRNPLYLVRALAINRGGVFPSGTARSDSTENRELFFRRSKDVSVDCCNSTKGLFQQASELFIQPIYSNFFKLIFAHGIQYEKVTFL